MRFLSAFFVVAMLGVAYVRASISYLMLGICLSLLQSKLKGRYSFYFIFFMVKKKRVRGEKRERGRVEEREMEVTRGKERGGYGQ